MAQLDDHIASLGDTIFALGLDAGVKQERARCVAIIIELGHAVPRDSSTWLPQVTALLQAADAVRKEDKQ
jgi:hypothetical protein